MKNEITTKRMTLKIIDDTYTDQVLAFVVRNKDFLKAWEPLRTEDFYTYSVQQEILRDEAEKMEQGLLRKFWLFQDGRIIGSVALSNIVRGAFQSCHMGYRIDEQEQGKGLMTEAVEAVVGHAFRELHLHRIEANIMPRNHASLRVVQKLGFQNEGISKKYLQINGKWEDHIHMVLLNEEME
ncbi:GNAT family N-acetyltransferase [Paenibacillus phoenicis]|uniref:GNAT family N-acetyltransferase n=1 Tax=Paenibacillus phoenicis TaxID=554117 RepID=A0ABU5PGS1_9BACL|nr:MULTISPECIES: GNAT family N-acetyltransferase [Paenibacillus]EES74927.1 putative ribosomal-protein-alanine acetyltransferase [Paenibacillus sp. oral taxon 786 str. D14]MCT2196478.1 GNAT family N-acetyltransferase [Paenibacillus sp. p3-SID1389]MEA3569139.1 GNAT family N-acetyltransferase [Paenibacillus phoenicis]